MLCASGCSIRHLATGALADALSGKSALGSDEDPELVRDAAPFGLKTMETLLPEQPHHVGLLTSLAGGFTQYAYAFVQQEADALEFAGKAMDAAPRRLRAKKLALRGRGFGLRGLEESSPGITEKLLSMKDLETTCAALKKEDVPLVYWTAAAWGLAISNGKEEMGLIAQLPAPMALLKKALELDETWNDGTLHELMASLESARPGGSEAEAKKHLDRAQQLNQGRHLGALVSWAEGPSVQGQRREEFEKLLKEVLAADVNSSPDDRLANTIAQRRAKLLLAHADDLFN
jgi:hypothetical protein